MNLFWIIWISATILIVIIGCAISLKSISKNTKENPKGEPMPHSLDAIKKSNNPLPKWWFCLLCFTIIVGITYPTVSTLLNWISTEKGIISLNESTRLTKTSNAQSQYEMNSTEEKDEQIFKNIIYDETGTYKELTELTADPKTIKIGQNLYQENCAQCHGSNARGSKGFPDLTDNDWLYGGDLENIKSSIMHGRSGQMPAWKKILREPQAITEITAYTLQLSGRNVNAIEAQAGKKAFVLCAGCHGSEGKGIFTYGAPNLTDNIWLYGGSFKEVESSIANGRHGIMPAWSKILSEEKVHLISVFVYSLSLEQ